ncbi:hypothetical protein [Sphingomonas prati]|uniref:Uncharacterized protein n=1 Tax=Sphingomonas prati TaxID=1843237 RepID=A0A7W9F1Z2_9SPHN|nr:hypothetical protein [Sphingomonas prati]MBB5727940.1 hypothetical protein [Sphingomonas prati]
MTDLVRNFAKGCRGLVPTMDAALVPWSEEEQHDNWERVASVLFMTLVSEPCEYAAVGEDGLSLISTVPYGWDVPPVDCNAYLAATAGHDVPMRVVRLSSSQQPFDQAIITSSSGTERISLSDASFKFVFAPANGDGRVVEHVDLTL